MFSNCDLCEGMLRVSSRGAHVRQRQGRGTYDQINITSFANYQILDIAQAEILILRLEVD